MCFKEANVYYHSMTVTICFSIYTEIKVKTEAANSGLSPQASGWQDTTLLFKILSAS